MELIENDSAAAKVFAIPELLEPILLPLPWYDLFVLQTINRTFHVILQKSKVLQKAMTMNWLGETDELRVSECIWDMSWSSFQPDFRHLKLGTDSIIWLAYEPTMERSPSRARKVGKYLGIGTWQQGVANGQGSWRQLRISTLTGQFRILVDVKLRLGPGFEEYTQRLCARQNGIGQRYEGYQDEIVFDSLTVTFGDVADALLEIMERSPEDHLSRAVV